MNYLARFTFFYLISHFCLMPIAFGQGVEGSSYVDATLLESSSMTIIGSSTLHDWEVQATDFSVQFQIPESWFDSNENWIGSDVALLNVTVPVDRLDGGKNKMNRDLRDALSYPEYQAIQFSWEQLRFAGDTDTGRQANVEGSVTIAGVTRDISFTANLSLNEWSQIVASGSVKLNMEDFEVDPPTAFFGVIRTNENVNLEYELFFGKGLNRD